MASLIYKELAYKVVGCAMEVHKVLGPGFLEAAYENAMKIELKILGLKYSAQVPYPIIYKGVHIKDYVCDLVVDDKIVIELKSMTKLGDVERAQIINYLKVTNLKLGLLINFGQKSLEYERFILTRDSKTHN